MVTDELYLWSLTVGVVTWVWFWTAGRERGEQREV